MQGTMRWGKLAFLCVLVLVAFLFIKNNIAGHVAEIGEEETVLRIQLSEMRDENASLQETISSVGSHGYIENRAREEYQFMKSGEMRFEFSNPQALYAYTAEEAAILAAEMGQ